MWRLFVFIYIRVLSDAGAEFYAPGKKLHNKGGIMFRARILGIAPRTDTPPPGRYAPLGAGGDEPAQVCGGLVPAQSCDRFPFMGGKGAERPGGDKPAAG